MSALPFALSLFAFALLGLATDAHHRRRLGVPPSRARQAALRRTAWPLLALAFAAAIATEGWIFGPVLWCGTVMAAAAATFLWLNLAPD